MIITRNEIIDLIESENYVTVVLNNNRFYSGFFISVSDPNFDNDCLIKLRDKNKKHIKFKHSAINVVEIS